MNKGFVALAFILVFFFALFMTYVVASRYKTDHTLKKDDEYELTSISPILVDSDEPIVPISSQSITDNSFSCPQKHGCWTLLSSGDVMLGRAVNASILKNRHNIFQNIESIVSSADIALTNLENPLISNCQITLDGMKFCGDSVHAESIKSTGFDVVSLANNHAQTDYGHSGLESTIQTLKQKGLKTLTQYQPVIIENERTHPAIAFIGVDTVIHGFDEAKFIDSMHIATNSAQVVIPFFSWGVEYTQYPSTRQKYIAHLAVDLGASVVLGNHPHWVQAIDFIEGVPVIYSHGNTVFDQMWSQETREGILSKLLFHNEILIDIDLIPIFISDSYSPQIIDPSDARHSKIIKRATQQLAK